MNNKQVKQAILTFIFRAVGYILLGVFLLVIPTDKLTTLIYYLAGGLLLLIGLKPLIKTSQNLQFESNWPIFILSLILVVLGLLLIFTKSQVIALVILIFLIIGPLLRIIVSDYKAFQFHQELGKLIVGVILLLIGLDLVVSVVATIVGVMLIIAGILDIIYTIKIIKLKDE